MRPAFFEIPFSHEIKPKIGMSFGKFSLMDRAFCSGPLHRPNNPLRSKNPPKLLCMVKFLSVTASVCSKSGLTGFQYAVLPEWPAIRAEKQSAGDCYNDAFTNVPVFTYIRKEPNQGNGNADQGRYV